MEAEKPTLSAGPAENYEAAGRIFSDQPSGKKHNTLPSTHRSLHLGPRGRKTHFVTLELGKVETGVPIRAVVVEGRGAALVKAMVNLILPLTLASVNVIMD